MKYLTDSSRQTTISITTITDSPEKILDISRMNSLEETDTNKTSTNGENDRRFNYDLTEKTMRAKILKGAKQEPLEMEERKTCTNLVFNAGAFQITVLPAVNAWKTYSENGQVLNCLDSKIKVIAYEEGTDKSGKHLDTKAVFLFDDKKITTHIYNTTQKIKVDGKDHLKFVECVLKPYFTKKINSHRYDISKTNENIIESLSAKTVKRSNVKYRGGSSVSLRRNKTLNSTLRSNISTSSIKTISSKRQSTRENSFVMNEEVSMAAIEDMGRTIIDSPESTESKSNQSINTLESHEMLLEEPSPNLTLPTLVTSLEEEAHDKSSVENEGISFLCYHCGEHYDSEDLLNRHEMNNHQEPEVKCPHCNVSHRNNDTLENHIKTVHTFKCDICNYSPTTKEYLEKHIRSSHPAERVIICGCLLYTSPRPRAS